MKYQATNSGETRYADSLEEMANILDSWYCEVSENVNTVHNCHGWKVVSMTETNPGADRS